MKHLMSIALATLLVSAPVIAADAANAPNAAKQKEYFEQHKAERLKHIKARQDLLSQESSCLQSASSVEAMQACNEKNKAAHQALEEQHKKDRMQKMQEQETKRRAEYDQKMKEMQTSPGKK
jgi:hypothetical protein